MSNYPARVFQGIKIKTCSKALFPFLSVLVFLGSATVGFSQRAGGPPAALPGPGMRERNRVMDDYDRDINRMKNDAKVAKERRRSLFPQINEDFQRIQVIHNEIVRMLKAEKGFDYDKLADLTADMKRRSARLRSNLALPEPEKTEVQATHSNAIDDSHVKKTVVQLHDLVVSFVANPIFKNLGVVDAKVIDDASENLNHIITVSDDIKRAAEILSKSAHK
jgi:hypothetical protein